jgi:DNA-binding transcriptional regulator YiaG
MDSLIIDTDLTGLAAQIHDRRELPPPAVRRTLREGVGVSQEDVARVCRVSRQAVDFWESGDRNPRGENLKRYLAVLRLFREAS